MKYLILSIYTAMSFGAIYGVDDRKEWYEVQNQALKEVSKSIAVMVEKVSLRYRNDSGGIRLRGSSFGPNNFLCKDEKFYKQRTGGVCSGFLIGPNKLITAGHCVKTSSDCCDYKWLFDFKYENELSEPHNLNIENMYTCKKFIHTTTSSNIFGTSNGKEDYAIIELDRVVDKKPLFVSTKKPYRGQKVTLAGYPNGLPLKIAQNRIVKRSKSHFFTATVDAFGGNSGSPVFDAKTLEVVGILTSGRNNFPKFRNKCLRVKSYSQRGLKSEVISSINNLKGIL